MSGRLCLLILSSFQTISPKFYTEILLIYDQVEVKLATSQISLTLMFPPYMYIVFMFVFVCIGKKLSICADCNYNCESVKPCIEPGCELSFQTPVRHITNPPLIPPIQKSVL